MIEYRHSYRFLMIFLFVIIIVPSGHPQNVLVLVLSSTEISVTWENVKAIDQNGVIVSYEVRYEPLETFAGQLTTEYVNITSGAVLNATLNGLQEFVEYNISVRAQTMVGAGPFNPEVTLRTVADGKLPFEIVRMSKF